MPHSTQVISWLTRPRPRLLARFTLGLLLAGLLCPVPLPAQAPAVKKEAAENAVPAIEQPAAGATPFERLIYLPYKNLKGVLEKDGATVFLPYTQFLKLWESAHPDAEGATKPPVSAVISKAVYTGRVENNLAKIDAAFSVTSLKKSWAEIPLEFGDAAVGAMTASDERVLLRGTGEGTYALLLPDAGEYTIKLELVSRVVTSTEGRSFELKCPAVGITTLEMTVPAPDQTVEVLPHLVSAPLEADANSTKVQASVGATHQLSARWFPRVSKAPEMELLASVSNQTHVRVADGLVHTDATLTYQVLRGQLDQVRIAVPAGDRILDVTAPSLKGWKSAKEANRQVLTIDLLSGSTKSLPVEIRTEHSAGEEPFELGGIDGDGVVHGIHALGAVRESGILVAGHGAEVALTVEEQQGLIRIEASEVPASLQREDNLYYRFYSPSYKLRVSAKPVEPRIAVEQRTRLEFRDDEIRLTTQFVYEVERAGIFELRYKVPTGLKIDIVESEQKKEFSVSPDGETLTVTLNGKQLGQIRVAIRGRLSHESGKQEAKLSLPLLEPLGVTRELGKVLVYAPEAIEVITDEKGIVAAVPDRTESASSIANMRLASAWTFNRRPLDIPVTTVRKPTRLVADVATTVNLKEGLAEITTLLEYTVLYAGIDTFRFVVPEAISAKLQIETVPEDGGPAIKQRSAASPKEGSVIWTVSLQRDVVGRQRFRVKYDLVPQAQAKSSQVSVEPLRALGKAGEGEDAEEKVPLARVSGEIAVLKERALSIAAVPTDLEAIDVRELTRLPQDGYLAYRYFKQPVALKLTVTKHDVQEVAQTVVSRALVEAVITQEEITTFRARFLLKSSERQRLTLELPKGAEPLGVTVAGKPVTLEKNPTPRTETEAYYINVARTTRSDDPFYVSVLFRTGGTTPAAGFRGTRPLLLPHLTGSDSAQSKSVVVQQLRVVVWVPEKFALLGTPDHFTLDRPLYVDDLLTGHSNTTRDTSALNQWIGDTGTSFFEFPTAGHAYIYSNLGGADQIEVQWWRSSWVVWFFSSVLFAIGFVLASTPWQNRLGILLLAVFAATLAAMQDADLVVHVIAACRFGLAAMLAYWIIRAVSQLPALPTAPAPRPALATTSVPEINITQSSFYDQSHHPDPDEPKGP